MLLSRYLPASLLAVLMLGLAGTSYAQTKSVRALIPWEGRGEVFNVGPKTVMFQGSLQGVIYVETAEGQFNEGFVMCPMAQFMSLETRTTSARGYCEIVGDGGDVVYAEYECNGQIGSCEGEFELTGGTGRFEGITGSSPLVVRAPMQAMATDVASGSAVRIASGLAILPNVTYTLRGN